MRTADGWLHDLFPCLEAWRAEPVETGMSGALVLRLTRSGEPAQYLKAGGPEMAAAIEGEALRLAWLGRAGVVVPRVLGQVRSDAGAAVRLGAIAGRTAADIDGPAMAEAEGIGRALARLHAIDPATCPFDAALAARLIEVAEVAEAGLIDPAELDPRNAGIAPEELLRLLMGSIPPTEDLVVTHGDATLANIVIADSGMVAFIDCGRLGRADRYRDLALAARDIRSDWGGAAENAFWKGYGIAEPDTAKLAFYELLEEFS